MKNIPSPRLVSSQGGQWCFGRKNSSKGFTLIELLIVIAIIGILSSIVLTSLNKARKNAKDASIKAAITESAKIAEVFYGDTGDYDLVCGESQFIVGGVIKDSISRNNGSFACGDTTDGYCFSATFNDGGSVCVDGYRELKYGFICDVTGDDIVCD